MSAGSAVAEQVRPLIEAMLGGDVPIRFVFWDGSALDRGETVATLNFRAADAVRRLVWQPNELGLGRAYVAGELDVDGDMFAAIEAFRDALGGSFPPIVKAVPVWRGLVRAIGGLGRPLPPPPEEAKISGWRRHTVRRDAQAISHHYNVGNEFYEIVLGPSMTYSCARFADPSATLEEAQAAKHELICRKLGLHERADQRLLDVGCGWGSMVIHAAKEHGARAVGVTISEEQFHRARQRVEDAGLAERVEIRLQDYRDLGGERFDAISSIGMSEHVGLANLPRYFSGLHAVLEPNGRLLNHAISSVGGSKMGRNSFVGRYVFPDGELVDVGRTVLAMEHAGFEVRDVEGLREHYARTLRHWVANLDANWARCVALVGEGRARVWKLYMTGSAVGFDDGGIGIHQVLGVKTPPSGDAAMPATRRGWG